MTKSTLSVKLTSFHAGNLAWYSSLKVASKYLTFFVISDITSNVYFFEIEVIFKYKSIVTKVEIHDLCQLTTMQYIFHINVHKMRLDQRYGLLITIKCERAGQSDMLTSSRDQLWWVIGVHANLRSDN